MFQKDNEFFSVCIPTYNRGYMIGAAIDSVLNQNYTNYELIICDNASTDNTEDVVGSFQDSRIKYFKYNDLVSMYANHNRCLNHAQGEWILYLHTDDRLVSLDNAAQTLKQNNWRKAIYMPRIALSEDSEKCPVSILGEVDYVSLFRKFNGMSPSGTLYSASLVKNLQGFKEDNIIADWEILLDARVSGYPVYELEGGFVQRFCHPGQATFEVSRSGESHISKSKCIQRSLNRLDDKQAFIREFVSSCTSDEIMLLYRYFEHLDLQEETEFLKTTALLENKFSYFSVDYYHALLDRLLGFKNYILFFRAVKAIQGVVQKS